MQDNNNDHIGAETRGEVGAIQRYTAALNAAVCLLGRPMTDAEESAFQVAYDKEEAANG